MIVPFVRTGRQPQKIYYETTKRTVYGLILLAVSSLFLFTHTDFKWYDLFYCTAIKELMRGQIDRGYFFILTVFVAALTGLVIRVLFQRFFDSTRVRWSYPRPHPKVKTIGQNYPSESNALQRHISYK